MNVLDSMKSFFRVLMGIVSLLVLSLVFCVGVALCLYVVIWVVDYLDFARNLLGFVGEQRELIQILVVPFSVVFVIVLFRQHIANILDAICRLVVNLNAVEFAGVKAYSLTPEIPSKARSEVRQNSSEKPVEDILGGEPSGLISTTDEITPELQAALDKKELEDMRPYAYERLREERGIYVNGGAAIHNCNVQFDCYSKDGELITLVDACLAKRYTSLVNRLMQLDAGIRSLPRRMWNEYRMTICVITSESNEDVSPVINSLNAALCIPIQYAVYRKDDLVLLRKDRPDLRTPRQELGSD